MNQAKKEFLSVINLPARLSVEETSWLLVFNEHDIPVLVAAGLLKPLGRPAATGSKYFATVELQALRNDSRWLAKVSDAIVNHWRNRNSSRRSKENEEVAVAG